MEFGSDFHIIDYQEGKSLIEIYPESNLYASGRQALLDLAMARGWGKLWVPSYFCEESLDCISRHGIELKKYNGSPLSNLDKSIPKNEISNKDALLVVNYFGLYGVRNFDDIGCEVVEDHTHNLIGDWAINSNADWCIASLRKTIPIADGGILWSPKHHILPSTPPNSTETEEVMKRRYNAMTLKKDYLDFKKLNKSEFLELFRDTESSFDNIPISSISERSRNIIEGFDINVWYERKKSNWEYISKKLENIQGVKLLIPENDDDTPFSITLLFENNNKRDRFRKRMIDKSVYPAILWNLEDVHDISAKSFADRMLSIHCDGRYSIADMDILYGIIVDSLI